MKASATLMVVFLALLLVLATQHASAGNLSVNPPTLTFTNVISSPSAAQTFTISNGTGNPVYVTASPHTQIHVDGFGWMSPGGGYFGTYGGSLTVSVRVSTDTPIDSLNESIPIYVGDYPPSNTHISASVPLTGSVPLPIQLASFKAATLASNGVTLTWTTASETNNYGFYVQRNGVDLTFIAGHGTTLQSQSYSYTDNTSPGHYQYRLKQVDLDGTATLSESVVIDVTAPVKFALDQNFPNPFNPSTRISFAIAKEGPVSLRIYDVLGREVATLVNENRKPGEYTERFDGSRLASGVYMYVLQTAEARLTSKMILSK